VASSPMLLAQFGQSRVCVVEFPINDLPSLARVFAFPRRCGHQALPDWTFGELNCEFIAGPVAVSPGLTNSFENKCAEMIGGAKRPPGFVIPAKAGIQANSEKGNKPGFPPARE
jgi:hypothetical protein